MPMFVDVIVEGITGLMLDKFTTDLLTKGPKPSQGKQELAPKEQAANRLYVDEAGVPVFPADNLLSCIIDAGRFIKIGKRQLSTRDTTTVTTFLNIIEPHFAIQSDHGWRVDARGVTNPATKGRHVCFRPLFDDWRLAFTLEVDLDHVSKDTVRELIDRSGRFIGIGVMRPARKGRYGQFKVLHWTERNEEPASVPLKRKAA